MQSAYQELPEIQTLSEQLNRSPFAPTPSEVLKLAWNAVVQRAAVTLVGSSGQMSDPLVASPAQECFKAVIHIANKNLLNADGSLGPGSSNVDVGQLRKVFDFAEPIDIPINCWVPGSIGLIAYAPDVATRCITSTPTLPSGVRLVLPTVASDLGIQLVTIEGRLVRSDDGTSAGSRLARWEEPRGWTVGGEPTRIFDLVTPPGPGGVSMDKLSIETTVQIATRWQNASDRRQPASCKRRSAGCAWNRGTARCGGHLRGTALDDPSRQPGGHFPFGERSGRGSLRRRHRGGRRIRSSASRCDANITFAAANDLSIVPARPARRGRFAICVRSAYWPTQSGARWAAHRLRSQTPAGRPCPLPDARELPHSESLIRRPW